MQFLAYIVTVRPGNFQLFQTVNNSIRRLYMTAKVVKLVAPNSLPIIGIKLADGSISEFEYSYNVQTQTSLYLLHDGKTSTTVTPTVLVDSAGSEWSAIDVEFQSLVQSKY
jgi:hypothetical protein